MASIWEGVWSQRNQAWLQKQTLSPFQLFLQSATNLRSFRKAHVRYNLQPRLDLPQRTNWEAPPPGVFKLNTDGATFEEDNAYGVGVVISD